MFHRSFAALVVASLAFTACRHQDALPPATPTPAPAPAPVPVVVAPVACGPIGVWKVAGPTGATAVDVGQGEASDVFVVSERSTTPLGPGGAQKLKLKVNVASATAGFASCQMAADCQTMSCGIAGQPPIVFNR